MPDPDRNELVGPCDDDGVNADLADDAQPTRPRIDDADFDADFNEGGD